jgi:type IV pilus assembly protein PilA
MKASLNSSFLTLACFLIMTSVGCIPKIPLNKSQEKIVSSQTDNNSVVDSAQANYPGGEANSSRQINENTEKISNAKQNEESFAKVLLGSINRSEQAFYVENGFFSTDYHQLGLGDSLFNINDNPHYQYSLRQDSANSIYAFAIPKSKSNRAWVSAVFSVLISEGMTTMAVLCQSNNLGETSPPVPILVNGQPVCAEGTTPLTR